MRPLSARAAATASLMAIITCRTKKKGVKSGQTQSGQTQLVKRNGSNTATGSSRRVRHDRTRGSKPAAHQAAHKVVKYMWSNTCGQIQVVQSGGPRCKMAGTHAGGGRQVVKRYNRSKCRGGQSGQIQISGQIMGGGGHRDAVIEGRLADITYVVKHVVKYVVKYLWSNDGAPRCRG